jgi:hypothetical protein
MTTNTKTIELSEEWDPVFFEPTFSTHDSRVSHVFFRT